MSEHAAILGLLMASVDLVTAVGERITPDQMDDPPVYPAITFQKMGGRGARGAVTNPGQMRASFQVSTWVSTEAGGRARAVQIAKMVRQALDRKRNMAVGDVIVKDCFYETDVDLQDPETGVCFNHMSFTLYYRET